MLRLGVDDDDVDAICEAIATVIGDVEVVSVDDNDEQKGVMNMEIEAATEKISFWWDRNVGRTKCCSVDRRGFAIDCLFT
jgi:hypothetical protein